MYGHLFTDCRFGISWVNAISIKPTGDRIQQPGRLCDRLMAENHIGPKTEQFNTQFEQT